jgi:alpha-beta hydrolase superfamily lysophospholipase
LFSSRFSLDSPTGALVNVFRADAEGHERGILLVLHGLAEHAERYARFAGEMAERGFHVYAPDHRGHGSTTASDAPLRRFAKRGGAAKVVGDCRAVLHRARAEHRRGLPVVAFGHSMGGLVALNLAFRHGREFSGLAVWNADPSFGLKEKLGVAALKAERALKGSDVASDLFARSTFEVWARAVENRRTDGDWLSHDEKQVDRYLNDPLCGWTPTVGMALDVLDLVRDASAADAWASLPHTLPLHVLAGSEDPATRRGEAAHALAGGLRHAGSRDVTLAIQEGARHETLNEVEPIRAGAIRALDAWLDRVVPPT